MEEEEIDENLYEKRMDEPQVDEAIEYDAEYSSEIPGVGNYEGMEDFEQETNSLEAGESVETLLGEIDQTLQSGENEMWDEEEQVYMLSPEEEEEEEMSQFPGENTTEDQRILNEELQNPPEGAESEGNDDRDSKQIGKALEGVEESDKANSMIPKMRSKFSMSNEQILYLNNPRYQLPFDLNIEKINVLWEDCRKEYCSTAFPQPKEDFQLTNNLLVKLVYGTDLDLPGNFLQKVVGRRLNNKDLEIVANFLENDTKVQRLNLAYNELDDEGALLLANILVVRTDITHVNLARNNFTQEGCYQLFLGLMQRSPLHSLKLTGIILGEKGWDGLICLTMCGSSPYDLDLSETDMSMSHFQGLCSAWQALDKDEDFPKFLLDHALSIPLEFLANMKIANNEARKEAALVNKRRSLLDLFSTKDDAGDMKDADMSEDRPEIRRSDVVIKEEKDGVVMLKGLCETQVLKYADRGDANPVSNFMEETENVDKMWNKSMKLPDTAKVIGEFRKIKDSGCLPMDGRGKPVIVCPSLYSLEVEGVIESEAGLEYEHFIPSALDDIVEGAKEMTKKEDNILHAADEDRSKNAAEKVVARAMLEAGHFVSKSDYGEKADSTQILLLAVLSTCQKAKEVENNVAEDFREGYLYALWDAATEKTVEALIQTDPETDRRIQFSPNAMKEFIRTFMETTTRTLLRLLDNPYVARGVFEASMEMCNKLAEEQGVQLALSETIPKGDDEDLPEWSEEDLISVYNTAMSFLEGVVVSAATLIGCGDPFAYKRQPISGMAETLDGANNLVDSIEERMRQPVDDFLLAGATLAVDIAAVNKKLDERYNQALLPSTKYVDDIFDQVAKVLLELDMERKGVVEEMKEPAIVSKYPFASRPARIVLNRPLFQDFESIMSAKLGEYLRRNIALKCLHLRKWNLAEDASATLMDGLSANSNIVLLDLGCNGIGPEGAKGLAKFVQQNPHLKHLILNHNRIRDPGLKYLFPSFPGSNIEFLNISYNDISKSLQPFLEILTQTKIKALYAVGNRFNQASWNILKDLFDTDWLNEDRCDFLLQDVDGVGMIVKNAQSRDTNEWYDVLPIVADGLHRAPYFEETTHVTSTMENYSL